MHERVWVVDEVAMEANQSSRKRKQQPNPLQGTLTRSKSRIYSHLNRSGRSRFDSAAILRADRYSNLRRHYHHCQPYPCPHPNVGVDASNLSMPAVRKLKTHDRAKEDEIKISYVSIKDLRARRVFSKPMNNLSVDMLDGLMNPNLISWKINCSQGTCAGANCDRLCGNGGELCCWKSEGNEKANPGFNYGAEGLSGKNPDLCSEDKVNAAGKTSEDGERIGFEKVMGFSANRENLNDSTPSLSKPEKSANLSSEQQLNSPDCTHMSDEENIQTTPPDTNILDKLKDDQNGANTEGKTFQAKDCFTAGMPLDGNPKVSGGSETSPNRRNGFVSRSKLVLNPCSRLKVFKTASSISYRRLLPYLMDIAKDKSCSLQSDPCSKLADSSEEKSSQASLSQESPVHINNLEKNLKSVPYSDCAEKAEEERKEERDCLDIAIGGSKNESCATETTSKRSFNDILPTSLISDGQIGMPLPIHSPEGVASPVEQLPESSYSKICNASPVKGSDQMSFSPAEKMGTSRRDSTSDAIHHPLSSTEGHCRSDSSAEAKNCEEAITVFQGISPLKVVPSSEFSAIGQAKGILKKNARGCRGLCTCLNCSSFRLNAERAFEFSRSQMQDTEELVLDLVKKLSQLRNILKKSVDDSNSKAILEATQVEEICEKASKAEELARIQVQQMNEDLFVHCRVKCLQRPRVNFAPKAEEKVTNQRRPPK